MSLTLYIHPVKSHCNKNCSFCITKRQFKKDILEHITEYLTIDSLYDNIWKYKEIINALKVDEFEFTGGGEPTLNSELFDIITFFRNNFPKIKTFLYTNGIIIPEIPKVNKLTISLSNDEVFEKDLEYFKTFKEKTDILRVRTYIDLDNIQNHKKLLKNLTNDSFIKERYITQYVLGKDFETNIMLKDKLKNYIFSKLVKLDENIKQCTMLPIIVPNGIVYRDWNFMLNLKK